LTTITEQTIAGLRPAAMKLTALDVTVLAGGPGGEREVSLNSGRAVYEALLRVGHRACLRDIGPADLSALDLPADFVFIALHGEFGEDGAVQAEIEKRRLPYAGSGPAASRLAMNKVDAKRRFEAAGIPTPAWAVATPTTIDEALATLPVPVVVKPVASGSSVDTSIARTPGAARTAVAAVVERYGQALIERYIQGPELTVGILGDDALPVCEIRPAREFYDYHAKYIDDDTQYIFEPAVSAATLVEVQRLSLAAHRALGCAVFSRVDWMVARGTGGAFVLEVNTIPGFTSHSLLPKAAARVGIGFDDLCDRIVRLSMEIRR
jgi:D-alanine-D-alanine ligase